MDENITITQQMADVIANNVGIQVSAASFAAITNGRIEVKEDCIKALQYPEADKELGFVQFCSGRNHSSSKP